MGLRGHLEKIEVGEGFSVITGWVASEKLDIPAKGPITISVIGHDFVPVQLEYRPDLADAKIAKGNAAFRVAIPVPLMAGHSAPISLIDGSGRKIDLICAAEDVVAFRPQGAIDSVGPEGIIGWIYDPGLNVTKQRPIVRYDNEYDELVSLKIIRGDLPFQVLGDLQVRKQGKLFGFRKEAGGLLAQLQGRKKSQGAAVEIKLISQGTVLWTHAVPVAGGQAAGRSPQNAQQARAEPTAPSARPASSAAATGPTLAELSASERNSGPWSDAGRPSLGHAKRKKMLVVSWDMGHNPIGRAYLLADIARTDFDVKLIGPLFKEYGTALWEPLRGQTALPIETFPGGSLGDYFRAALKAVEQNPADVVYVSKPRLPSLIFGMLMRLRHGSALVVDSDDHELSFFKNETPLSLKEALAAVGSDPKASEMPFSEVWTRLCEDLLKLAGAVTVSNVALQKKFGGTIVRHARDERTFIISAKNRAASRKEFGIQKDQIVVLFLGTPRPHKGIFKVAEILDRIGDPRLVLVIVGTINDARVKNQLATYKRANIKYFGNQPWSRLHEIVAMADIAPVLQLQESKIADYQIPAKLTDAMALNIPVLATKVPPLEDFSKSGALTWIEDDQDLEKVLRARLASDDALKKKVEKSRQLYLKEFTYAVNTARIKAAADQAAGQKASPALEETVIALFKYAGVQYPYKESMPPVQNKPVPTRRKGPRDLIFFWKQNDTDLYGRRSDMMMKYLLESGKVRKILQLDRAINLTEINAVVDHGQLAPYHEGNLVYLNTIKRLLKMADTRTIAKRTFLYRSGSQAQTFFGQELPPRDAYVDFVKEALEECGMDPNPMAWVCPVVFDFPAFRGQLNFGPVVVDIVDDQRRWKAQESYMRRVEQNYVDILKLGDIVLSNCEPVREGFQGLRDDIMIVPNGVELFPADQKWSLPPDIADLPRPLVGYVGNLRDRVDIVTIREMAEKRPKWSVALIGSAGGSLDVLALGSLPNVHLLGVKPYEQALHYIKNFDVAIMPHVKNAISENMNPLKLYVYFALGVPIVTTNVANIGDISPYVSVVDTSAQFIRAIEANLNGKGPKVSEKTRQATLEKVSWKSRVNEVLTKLKL